MTLTNESTKTSITLYVKDAQHFEGKGYKFSIPLAAKEASDTISAKVFDGNGNALTIVGNAKGDDYTETGVQSTLMTYMTWLAENGADDKEKALGAAAKDYCAAAQIYFGYYADGLSVSGAVGGVTEQILAVYAASPEGTLPDGVSVRGITAIHRASPIRSTERRLISNTARTAHTTSRWMRACIRTICRIRTPTRYRTGRTPIPSRHRY